MNNNFDILARVALNEASLGDYMRVVKNSVKSTAKAATSPLSIAKGVAKAADFFASKSGMQYGGQFGTIANKIGDLQALGASAEEERVMQELYGKNPKKGDPIDVEVSKDISVPKAFIKDTKPGPGNDTTAYTVDLFPMGYLTSFKTSSQSTKATGLTPEQSAIQAAKTKSPVDQIIFTRGNKDYGSTNVKLSFYKDGKLVSSRNIPGLKDDGGLHFNGEGKPWTLNLDASDSINFTDVKAMIAASPDLKLSTEQQQQIMSAKNYPEVQKIVRDAGKETLYMKAYSKAVAALRQGAEPPEIAAVPASATTTQGQEPEQTATNGQQNPTTGINARTPEGVPVAGQTRFTTADKKKTYLYGKNGWVQKDPNTNKWNVPVQQQKQITAAWQKSQNIKPTTKPAATNNTPAVPVTKGATRTKTGVPVTPPTRKDETEMNLPPHPLHSKSPVNRRR